MRYFNTAKWITFLTIIHLFTACGDQNNKRANVVRTRQGGVEKPMPGGGQPGQDQQGGNSQGQGQGSNGQGQNPVTSGKPNQGGTATNSGGNLTTVTGASTGAAGTTTADTTDSNTTTAETTADIETESVEAPALTTNQAEVTTQPAASSDAINPSEAATQALNNEQDCQLTLGQNNNADLFCAYAFGYVTQNGLDTAKITEKAITNETVKVELTNSKFTYVNKIYYKNNKTVKVYLYADSDFEPMFSNSIILGGIIVLAVKSDLSDFEANFKQKLNSDNVFENKEAALVLYSKSLATAFGNADTKKKIDHTVTAQIKDAKFMFYSEFTGSNVSQIIDDAVSRYKNSSVVYFKYNLDQPLTSAQENKLKIKVNGTQLDNKRQYVLSADKKVITITDPSVFTTVDYKVEFSIN
jgi:hypothetical protein